MPDVSIWLWVVLFLTLCGEFINGWTDAPNAIATAVSTRVLSPLQAVIIAAVLNTAGVLLGGTTVAITVGKNLVDTSAGNLAPERALLMLAAALIGIVVFSSFAWYFGLPVSKSHELFAGMAGAAIAMIGVKGLVWSGWSKILIGLALSTFLGFISGLVLMTIIYWVFMRVHLGAVRNVFHKLQILSTAFVSYSHGTNDGQKFMGIFTLALVLGGIIPAFHVPYWVIPICALTMGFGTIVGGWRIMKTMGFHITKLEPVHGFAAQTAAAATIELASQIGVPLSTTHTISTAIMGVGSTRRFSAVRWGVSKQIVIAWILTFPCCAIIAYLVTKLMMLFT